MPHIAEVKENVKREDAPRSTAEVIPFPKSAETRNDLAIYSTEAAAKPVFATWAPELWQAGLAVMPLAARTKTPLINSFGNWGTRPGLAVLSKWCEQFPDANIGVVPGRCQRHMHGRFRRAPMMVADCDTFDAAEEFEDRFGRTDRKVETRRGRHLYYEATPFKLPRDLKKLGLEVDLKCGNQYVVGPYSIHESGHRYFESDPKAAPGRLNLDAFRGFIHPPEQQDVVAQSPEPSGKVRSESPEDSRGLWVNRMWCANTDFLANGSFDEVLMMGFKANDWLGANHERGRLPEEEIISRARQYWKDVEGGKLKRWAHGARGVIRTHRSELERLKKHAKHGTDAIALLSELRSAHSREKEFAIAATAMSKTGFMPRKRIEKARAILIGEGFLEKVSPAKCTANGWIPAKFKFVTG